MKATRHKMPPMRIRRNLARLALFLNNMNPLYRSNTEFDMDVYFRAEGVDFNPYDAKKHYNECGTSACAAGHGPIAGIRPRKYDSWPDYIERDFLGMDSCSNDGWALFRFLFGQSHPDDPQLAAMRIANYAQEGIIYDGIDYTPWYEEHGPLIDWDHIKKLSEWGKKKPKIKPADDQN